MVDTPLKIAIVGGGASGYFAAITVREKHPHSSVVIFEKASQPLGKVKISGGGRCNLTHAANSVSDLCKGYPRGGNSLKKIFHRFDHLATMQWFEQRGLQLVTQTDGCVFPASQDAMSVVNLLQKEAADKGVRLVTNAKVIGLQPAENGFFVSIENNDQPQLFDKVIVTTGGSPQLSGLTWLQKIGHQIEKPVPSLFTFKIPNDNVTQLMGIVIEEALVSLSGTKLQADGPLLITHWGMSGPAVLKLSAWAARLLNDNQYQFNIRVSWVGKQSEKEVINAIQKVINEHPFKQLVNFRPFGLPQRLWDFLLQKCHIPPEKPWVELGKHQTHQLVNILTNDTYAVSGKTTFREEFVTCGGVSLQSVDMNSLQSKVVPGLYFAGEVLDIDGITGGFNLQAAWSTGFVAGELG